MTMSTCKKCGERVCDCHMELVYRVSELVNTVLEENGINVSTSLHQEFCGGSFEFMIKVHGENDEND